VRPLTSAKSKAPTKTMTLAQFKSQLTVRSLVDLSREG
jgi:hypothetical protein